MASFQVPDSILPAPEMGSVTKRLGRAVPRGGADIIVRPFTKKSTQQLASMAADRRPEVHQLHTDDISIQELACSVLSISGWAEPGSSPGSAPR